MAGSNSKKKRKTKVSKGINGATKHRLSEVEKVLLSKGLFVSRMRRLEEEARRRGIR